MNSVENVNGNDVRFGSTSPRVDRRAIEAHMTDETVPRTVGDAVRACDSRDGGAS